jgi:hypothetical protein
MHKPSSKLHGMKVRLHRPSPSMMVASAALFLSLGGAGYAAVAIPNASVGANQLKTFAVTNPKLAVDSVGYRKIQPGAIGTVRVDKNDVQLRVTGTCTAADEAITSVNITGGTTCGTTSPTETNTSTPTTATTLSGASTTLASYSLTGGAAYFVQAAPYIAVKGGSGDTYPQTVTVACTLSAGTSTTSGETEDTTVTLGASGTTHYASIPLTVVAPESANAITSAVSCLESSNVAGDSPVVTAQSTIYAMNVNPTTETTTTSAG